MFNEFLKATQDLYAREETFAIAVIVNRKIPSSAKTGDKAVIKRDGTVIGWIGGGCTRGIVVKEALAAISDGKPRYVSVGRDNPDDHKRGITSYKMTCQSGGEVDIYIEPVLPKPELIIVGKSQIARALAKVSKSIDYQVSVVAIKPDKEAFQNVDSLFDDVSLEVASVNPNSFIVVCTQGENDAEYLEQAVRSGARYVAFVSSRKKANSIFNKLKKNGISIDQLKNIKTPAGIDINAKLPGEVAISIMAEIISTLRDQSTRSEADDQKTIMDNTDYFINPVCDIPIQKSTAKHIIKYEEVEYYFCCDGCKISFEQDPAKYAIKVDG
jgi:xanthine dehydrogenase accessory factor